VNLFLSDFRMNFPEIVDIRIPAWGTSESITEATVRIALGQPLAADGEEESSQKRGLSDRDASPPIDS